MGSIDIAGGRRPLDTVIVCHSEYLIAAAAAAVLENSGTVRSTVTVTSLTRLLSRVHTGVDVAVVFDAMGEDLPELFEALRHRDLALPVLIVTEQPSANRAADALEWGAAGTVALSGSVQALCRGVLDAHVRNAVFPDGQRHQVIDVLRERRLRRYRAQRTLAQLSLRERHVLRSLAAGRSVSDIAVRMSVSPHTVRAYVHTLGHKLDTHGQLRIAAAGRTLLSTARRVATEAAPGDADNGVGA